MAARVAGRNLAHAAQGKKNRLGTPEAATTQNSSFRHDDSFEC
jgi:hypothetical protein